MTKFCPKCKTEKELSHFHKSKKDKLQGHCKQCQKSYHRRHYLENKSKYIEKARVNQYANKEIAANFVNKIKRLPCTDCGKSYHPVAMDFDHVLPGKEHCVSKLVHSGANLSKIKNEIAKCELVCAICHRMRTHIRRTFSAEGGDRTRSLDFGKVAS